MPSGPKASQGCCEVGKLRVCVCGLRSIAGHHPPETAPPLWPWGPTHTPAGPPSFFIIYTEAYGHLHLTLWHAHRLFNPPLASWLLSRHHGYPAKGGVFLPSRCQQDSLMLAQNSPQRELKALFLTGQDIAHCLQGGSSLGWPTVTCRILYFGTSLERATLFWFKFIIPSIPLELNFLGDYLLPGHDAILRVFFLCDVSLGPLLSFMCLVSEGNGSHPPLQHSPHPHCTNMRFGVLALYTNGQWHRIPKILYIWRRKKNVFAWK